MLKPKNTLGGLNKINMDATIIQNEFDYRTSRSGGKGGQNVNKVETKVEVLLDLNTTQGLNEVEKALVMEKLSNKISSEGLLSVTHQTERSQLANKQKAETKLLDLIKKALIVPKKRKFIPTPPSVLEARAKAKRIQSEKKETRKRINLD
jgi:ribosome-associated protein